MLDEITWLARLEASCTTPDPDLPGFPDEQRQKKWVGRSGADALREVYFFYRKIKSFSKLDGPILDFCIGWGRVSRMFLNEVNASNIYGVEINSHFLDECRRLAVPAQLAQIDPLGALPYEDNKFRVVYAYSVFTHLSKKSADHWAQEIYRVLQPGGLFIFTIWTDETFENIFRTGAFSNMKESRRRYLNGEFVFESYRDTLTIYTARQHCLSLMSKRTGPSMFWNTLGTWATAKDAASRAAP